VKVTPGTNTVYESDGHVVLLPPGLTGTVELEDGTVVDLGPANQVVIEVGSHDQAKEVALAASQLAHESEDLPNLQHDEAQSRKNLGLKKKGS
jgi:hypothetical protein